MAEAKQVRTTPSAEKSSQAYRGAPTYKKLVQTFGVFC